MTFDDDLTPLLDASAPRVPQPTLTEQVVLGHMATAPSAGRRTRTRRRVAIGLVAGVAALAGGTAVAADAIPFPWDQEYVDPDLLYTYTLPSGGGCEMRWNGTDDAVGQAVRELAQSTDLVALADVDGEIARLRAEEHTWVNADGTEEPGGFGTSHYDADSEYSAALTQAVADVVDQRLRAAGVDLGPDGWSTEALGYCPDASWIDEDAEVGW